jgi:hypothetical protein
MEDVHMGKIYNYEAVISESKIGKGGAYVIFPYDAYDEFGQKRVKVHATFDGEPYDGIVSKMGVFDENGEGVYLIVVPKAIRDKIGKQFGDKVKVAIKIRGEDKL